MVTGSAGISGSLANSGDISVGTTARVTADGAAGPLATTAIANASSIGLLTAGGAGIGGDFSNSARILSLANAAARAGGTGTAEASAYAYGIAIDATGGIGGSISNSGFIGAAAEATATGSSTDARAVATGLQIAQGSVGGSISNSGTLAAVASGTDVTVVALALGTSLAGGTLSPAESTLLATLGAPATLAGDGPVTVASGIVNSGLISANAIGTQSASATAIRVAGGSVIGTLTNTGTIKATASGGSATAIDLAGEGGATRVFLQDGGVIGDIVLSSHHVDTIVWSGGTFAGDVFGGGLGSLAVLAGTASSFAYSGTLESLASVTVGGEGRRWRWHSPARRSPSAPSPWQMAAVCSSPPTAPSPPPPTCRPPAAPLVSTSPPNGPPRPSPPPARAFRAPSRCRAPRASDRGPPPTIS
ncbi:hypothetical protein EZH22_20825 [Xanthobacter dioxanivorans]|uniref:Uncharacterized protein n=2 Tax=Xanthobacter dioxanivorans TaxID=2528964 RepID=A0A974SHU8_9HYPH|nr:hypothetical protein [Xanthobacter dioxanivorans]QRG05499.1 hypothetical protein EZH22_20825 [Xanthobacter dioxanivorans]